MLPCILPSRILHLQQVGSVVVGEAGVVEVEILSRFQSQETVTSVVNQVTMCGNFPSGTCTGTHPLLVLRILIPRCIKIGS